MLPGSFEMLPLELSTHDPFLSNQGDRAYPQTSAWLPFCRFLPPTKEECMSLSDSTRAFHPCITSSIRSDITVNHLQEKFIRWPDAGERAAIAQSFATKKNFPGIIGAVDGSHIPIIAPNE